MFGTRSPFKGWPKTSVLRNDKGFTVRARYRTPFLAKQYRRLVKWGGAATVALSIWHSNLFEMTGNFLGNAAEEARRNGSHTRTPELFGYFLQSLRLSDAGTGFLVLFALGAGGLSVVMKRRVSIKVTGDRVRIGHEGLLFRTYDLATVQRVSIEEHPGAMGENYREAVKGKALPLIYRNAARVVMWYGGGEVVVCSIYPQEKAAIFADRLNQVLGQMKQHKPRMMATEMEIRYGK